jgi:multimeric flavodoxin WrbA
MKALIVNCTLKASPERSNTEALAEVVVGKLRVEGVEVDEVRAVDKAILPGVESDMGEGDEWPAVREAIVAAAILVIATPTWLARPSSVAQRVLERMDAMIGETDDDGRPIAYGKVAGVVVTGNEDGAHHVISEVCGALIDIGFTVPGQAWTYWNRGPGPGKSYLEDDARHDWSRTTGETAAQNLVTVAKALAITPFQVPCVGRLGRPTARPRVSRRGWGASSARSGRSRPASAGGR